MAHGVSSLTMDVGYAITCLANVNEIGANNDLRGKGEEYFRLNYARDYSDRLIIQNLRWNCYASNDDCLNKYLLPPKWVVLVFYVNL